jgi:hypothetical protein
VATDEIEVVATTYCTAARWSVNYRARLSSSGHD